MSAAQEVAIDEMELLSPEDVERLWKINLGTQRGWRARRVLPFVRLGKLVRYRRADLHALLVARTVAAKPPEGKRG